MTQKPTGDAEGTRGSAGEAPASARAARGAAAVASATRPPVVWRWIAAVGAVQLLAFVLTNGRYGMFRDEFYYLACTSHLSWGYVDQPPFSIALLAGWKGIFGDGVGAIRIPAALAAVGTTVLAAGIAREMRGRAGAQILAAVCTAFAPLYLALGGFYSMNPFDVLVWTLSVWLLLLRLRTGDDRLWLLLGVVLGIGLMNKISVLALGLGLAGGLLLTSHRALLRTRGPWIAAAIALVLFVPHIVWQMANGWPTLEFMENARRYKIAAMSPFAFFSEQVMQMHPVYAPLWLAGLGVLLFSKRAARYRLLAYVYLIAYLVFALQRSKPYYLGAAYVPLFAAGACALERVGRRWIMTAATALAAGAGILVSPTAIPVLSVEGFITYQERLGLAPRAAENHDLAELPQHFADRFGWQNMTATVAEVYRALPDDERARAKILCGNYGEAGAITYYGRSLGLPPAISTHNSYYLWGPGDDADDVFVVVGIPEEALRQSFAEVERAAVLKSVYAMPYEAQAPIMVARRLTRPLDEAWRAGKSYN